MLKATIPQRKELPLILEKEQKEETTTEERGRDLFYRVQIIISKSCQDLKYPRLLPSIHLWPGIQSKRLCIHPSLTAE